MRLVVTPAAEDVVRSHGGEVWIRARGSLCCRVSTWTLDASTDPQKGDLVRSADKALRAFRKLRGIRRDKPLIGRAGMA